MTIPPTSQTNPLDPVFSGVPVVYPQTGMINPTWNKWFVDVREKLNVINAGTATPVLKVHAGTNVTVDNTDPQNPIVSSSGALPAGGTAGQVLTKIDSSPGNADWQTSGGGGGGSNYLVPPFADVSSLLHFNGTNGSTTFTDQVAGNTWTATNVTISTAQSLFGGGSGLFTGAPNSAIVMPTNSKFNIGTNPWTLELSIYPNGTHQTGARLFQTSNGDVYAGINVALTSGQTFVLYMSVNGSSWAISGAVPFTLGTGVWNRVLIQYTGSLLQSFVNGSLASSSSATGLSPYYNSSDSIVIGGQTVGTSRSINAYVDEFRFTNGLALVSYYPVTTAEFPNS